jgi:hypothetical protein
MEKPLLKKKGGLKYDLVDFSRRMLTPDLPKLNKPTRFDSAYSHQDLAQDF